MSSAATSNTLSRARLRELLCLEYWTMRAPAVFRLHTKYELRRFEGCHGGTLSRTCISYSCECLSVRSRNQPLLKSNTALLWRGICHGLPCTVFFLFIPGNILTVKQFRCQDRAQDKPVARQGRAAKLRTRRQCQAPPPPPPLPGLHEGWRVPAGPPAGPEGLTFDTAPCGHPLSGHPAGGAYL